MRNKEVYAKDSRDLPCSYDTKHTACQLNSGEKSDRATHGHVGCLVVNVDERAFNTWECLDLVLQLLGKVVRLPQGRICTHDDVKLDEVVLFSKRHVSSGAGLGTCGQRGNVQGRSV